MAGGANLLVDLEAALKLAAVILSQRSVEREGNVARLDVKGVLDALLMLLGDIGIDAPAERDAGDQHEAEADEDAEQADHESSFPYSAAVAGRTPERSAGAASRSSP